MTSKENLLRVLHHDHPEQVPNGMESMITLGPPHDHARPPYRRTAFGGGIRPRVTPDEVRAEVRRRIRELGTGGGYIAAPSHGVPYDPAIIDAMNDEIACFGREFDW